MHEMSIANSIIQEVRREAKLRGGAHARRVGVKVGELAGIDAEALRFCFEVLVRDTELRGVELQIEFSPRRHRCPTCGHLFDVVNYQLQCPLCGDANTAYVSGDEMELSYLEVGDAAGAVAAQDSE
jgi:hydrogenase nickel incorporation protein HypA/HybF